MFVYLFTQLKIRFKHYLHSILRTCDVSIMQQILKYKNVVLIVLQNRYDVRILIKITRICFRTIHVCKKKIQK